VDERTRSKISDLSADQRPDQRFKPGPFFVVGERQPRQCGAIDSPGRSNIAAPASNDLINNVLLLIERVDDGVG
jgi:hypothetical protein